MPELPGGTVTMLFTDVEGSTRLLAEHGDGYGDLLAEHRRLLREAFARHDGVEVDTQGDAFFVAFARASDAAAAALAGQEALAPTPVTVRMGLHTGEPRRTDEGYVGMDVHLAARVAATAHGGQVVVTEQTAQLLGTDELRDLGEHRLKDVGRTRIFQLGQGDFPPLKTLHQTNLPAPSTPLVGRKKELLDVVRLLSVERARIVTLTGPGGIGKTRFALAAAADTIESFADGVWFVDASALRDPSLVLPAVASALGAQVTLADHISNRELLVVLDNLEQVIEAAAGLAGLVDACARLQLLATSREPLRVAAEQEYSLRPLPESPAVELFRQRARAAAPGSEIDYELAAAICERLDRLPLAIELAAARVRALDPPELLERLERRLPLLASRARDLPERQRTLHETIAWSHELLSPDEQQLFARLAVFAGGCTLAAAEEVCDADLDVLEGLVDKSLLRRRGERFAMLETIREFAAERLEESDEAESVRRLHAEYFLRVTSAANLSALEDGAQDHRAVERDQDNLRAALDWAVARGEVELGLRLAVAAENFWVTRSPAEGHRRTAELLEQGGERIPGRLRADGLRTCASTTYIVGDYERGTGYIERSLDEYRKLDDDRGVGHLELRLAVEMIRVGENARGRELVTRSLESASRTGYRRGEAQGLRVLAALEFRAGREDEAMELLRRSADVSAEIGFTWWQSGSLRQLGFRSLGRGRLDDAERWARESLELDLHMGDRQGMVEGLATLAAVEARADRPEAAGRLWGAVEAEEERGRVGQWEDLRDEFYASHLDRSDERFERGREGGRSLSLVEAVSEVLAEGRRPAVRS